MLPHDPRQLASHLILNVRQIEEHMTGPRILIAACLLGSGAAAAQEADHSFAERLVDAALERTSHSVVYDGNYRRIGYPGGDVPSSIGVCTDVVIRAYRQVGVDLQKAVHEDMVRSFAAYPKNWGLSRPDSNIDHRRVPNLQVFFSRNAVSLQASNDPDDYTAGDLVTWMLPGNLPHIGIVVDRRSADDGRPLVVHNIGAGPKLEDVLFDFPITGHYRYAGPD